MAAMAPHVIGTATSPWNVGCFTRLAGLIVPSLVIGFGIVIPDSCIAGADNLTVGFASSLLGACGAY